MKYKQVPISVIIGALVDIFIINLTRIYDKEKNIENEENVTNNEYLPGKKQLSRILSMNLKQK